MLDLSCIVGSAAGVVVARVASQRLEDDEKAVDELALQTVTDERIAVGGYSGDNSLLSRSFLLQVNITT